MGPFSDTMIFHMGLIVMLLSVAVFAVCLCCWRIRSRRIETQLDAEYGENQLKTGHKKKEARRA